jgi:hypothetical protein
MKDPTLAGSLLRRVVKEDAHFEERKQSFWTCDQLSLDSLLCGYLSHQHTKYMQRNPGTCCASNPSNVLTPMQGDQAESKITHCMSSNLSAMCYLRLIQTFFPLINLYSLFTGTYALYELHDIWTYLADNTFIEI